MRRIKRHTYFLIGIILIGAFLRFHNMPFRYSLSEETVRDAVVGIEAARQIQLPLTGAFSSLGPFTFGPLYTYQLAIFTFIFRHNYSPWIYLGTISVAYIYVMYKIGEILHGKNFGLLLAVIATLSPAQIISGTHLTSHNNTNIFAVLMLFIFLKIVTKNISLWWGFLLGVVLGIGMNLHYQMTGLFVLPFVLLLYKPKKYLYFLNSILGVVITFIPLLIFELNNHWFNIRNMIYYFLHGKNAIYVPNRWLFYIRDFWPAFWADALGVPVWLGSILMMGSLLTLGYLLYKRKLSFLFLLLLICFGINFIMLRFYWGPRFFGYLNFLRPFVFIFTAFLIFQISKLKYGRIMVTVLGVLILFTASPRFFGELQKDPFTLRMYQNISVLEEKFRDKKITLYGCRNFYRGGYNSIAFSSVFLLDLRHRLGEDAKIGLKSQDCQEPRGKHAEVSEIGFLDFSGVSKDELKKLGWEPVTFDYIYELNARWWFKEQP